MIIASYSNSMQLPAESLDDMSQFLVIVKGPCNGALSLDIITILGLELLTQLEEESGDEVDGTAPNAAKTLGKAARAPIFQMVIRPKFRTNLTHPVPPAATKRPRHLGALQRKANCRPAMRVNPMQHDARSLRKAPTIYSGVQHDARDLNRSTRRLQWLWPRLDFPCHRRLSLSPATARSTGPMTNKIVRKKS